MAKLSSQEIHDSQRKVAKLMKRILTHFRAAMDEELKPYGVTSAQIKLLWAIRNAPGSSGAQVARICEVTPQTAQELILKAEEGGWIVRGKDSVNERIVTAALTRRGRRCRRGRIKKKASSRRSSGRGFQRRRSME